MKSKLQKIKSESQSLCAGISSSLRGSAAQLNTIADNQRKATAPFNTQAEFDAWFNSDETLVL